VRERYYAISVERRLKHAAVAAITSAARTEVFAARRKPTRRPASAGD
jgi:LysR family transcriptional activator of nhaA